MSALSAARAAIAQVLAEWQGVRLADLQFRHDADMRLMLLAGIGLLLVLLIARLVIRSRPERRHIILPALPRSMARSRGSFLRHVPLLVFLLGLPFFALALADPHTPLVGSDASFPGRRVALLIDASISMLTPFIAAHLNETQLGDRAQKQLTFYTTVAAARQFVEMRKQNKYRDLIALVEFGDEAYTVTPFTNDYDNILLSISLIGEPVELGMFPDRGTLIGQAIQQSVDLFKAFKFLDATGNMMVIFTDGEDAHAVVNGVDLDQIMQMAVAAKIPVYFVRTNYGRAEGQLVPDALWRPAVARTGGRFFAAQDERSLLDAIGEIDRVSAGTIQVRRYSTQQPRFATFSAIAIACWVAAAGLKFTVPYFRTLP